MRLHEFAINVVNEHEPSGEESPGRVMLDLDNIESMFADNSEEGLTVVNMKSGNEFIVHLPYSEVVNAWMYSRDGMRVAGK